MNIVKILTAAIEEIYDDLAVKNFEDAIIRVHKDDESIIFFTVDRPDLLAQWHGGSSRIKLSHPDILNEIRRLIDRI